MRRGGQGPTWGMVVFGLALAAEGLEQHAAREDELVGVAYRLATEITRTDARAQLGELVRADPAAAEVAHRTCLARSAENDASDADAWLDAANLLARARADQASLTSS